MKYLANICLLFIFVGSTLFASLEFTKEEQKWIQEHPVVTFGADYKWPPFDFIDSNGNHTGLAHEYIELISKKSGLKFNIEAGVWSDILTNMKAKKYDGLTCAVETDERKKYLRFTQPYLSVPMVIITDIQNTNLQTIDDLKGKTVSINKGSYIHEWLTKQYPEIKLYLTTSNEASLEAVSLGKADAYVGNLAVATYIMNKYLLNNLKIVAKLKGFDTVVSVAIDKEKPILFNIIQKTLNSITPQEQQLIKSKWKENLHTSENEKVLQFSAKQQKWIDKHRTLRYVIDNDWMPIEYFSQELDAHAGITSSYLELITQKTGLHFELVKTDSWSESTQLVKERKADLYTCVAKNSEREKYVKFSKPYFKLPQVFVTNESVDYIADIKELYGKKIVLVKDYYITNIIKKQHPKINIIEVNKITDALKLLTDKKAYAYIDALPIVSYYIQKIGFSNLKISGMSEYETKFSMAMRNDFSKEGIEVINKALNSISEEEKSTIYNKWLSVKYEKEIDYTLVWQIASALLIVIMIILFYTRKLFMEIEKRKTVQMELEELNKKLEIATQKAISASKAKSDFLSNMSHEIRTPMNAILGFAELLDEKLQDRQLKSFVKTIRSSGETLLHLINDILDLSKIESGKLELIKSKVNVKNMIEESLGIFRLQATEKGLKLLVEIDENMPVALLLDPVRFKEIIINLVANAMKFTDEGYIKVVAKVDEVYNHKSKVDITIQVQDTGIGIAKSDQKKIFRTFEQRENQDLQKYGGTGLGLSISKKLAEMMNGSLEVESEVGSGSTFVLKLKYINIVLLNDYESLNDNSIESSMVQFDEVTILTVDDVEYNRKLIQESFAEQNINILEAKNGKEAIDIVQTNKGRIKLILMDIRMPIMDGYTAARLIKKFAEIPIIALTASIMKSELIKLEEECFDGYLRKPVSKEALYNEVSKFLTYKSLQARKKELQTVHEVENLQQLQEFLKAVDTEVKTLYEQAVASNDLEVITSFAKLLHSKANEHQIKSMVNFSQTLLQRIEMFEIKSINTMLHEYEVLIVKYQERVNNEE